MLAALVLTLILAPASKPSEVTCTAVHFAPAQPSLVIPFSVAPTGVRRGQKLFVNAIYGIQVTRVVVDGLDVPPRRIAETRQRNEIDRASEMTLETDDYIYLMEVGTAEPDQIPTIQFQDPSRDPWDTYTTYRFPRTAKRVEVFYRLLLPDGNLTEVAKVVLLAH